MALLMDNNVIEEIIDISASLDAIEDAFTQLGTRDAAFQPRTDIIASTVDLDGELDYYWWANLIGTIRDPPRLAFRFRSDILSWHRHDDGRVTEEKFNVEPNTYMGFILLFDTSSGELLGLLNDGALQHFRVGATAGMGCKHLARSDAERVGILGSGGMARTYAHAFAEVRDVTSIKIYSPTRSHRESYASEMSDQLGIDVRAVDSAEAAMQDVDIAATCTNSGDSVFEADWVDDGTFVVDVKSNEISRAAIDRFDTVIGTTRRPYLADSDYVVGSEELYEKHVEYHGERGFEEQSYPVISEVLVGDEPGREYDDESIYFHNRSAGIQFAAVCSLVYERARQRGLGTRVPLEWFQQDIRD